MKNKEKWLLLVFTGLWGFAGAQDTIVLRNNTRVVCTVTQIYAERIEYVSFGDSVKKQFYSYRKNDVMLVRYADGRTDTFNNMALVVSYDDTSAEAKRQYRLHLLKQKLHIYVALVLGKITIVLSIVGLMWLVSWDKEWRWGY